MGSCLQYHGTLMNASHYHQMTFMIFFLPKYVATNYVCIHCSYGFVYVLLNMFVNLEMLREVIMCLFVYFQVIMKLLVDEEL